MSRKVQLASGRGRLVDCAAVADVFISYATQDRRASQLAGAFAGSGLSVELDRGVPARSTLHKNITRQFERAKCVLPLWSHHAARSMWVLNHSRLGRERGVLLPVLIEPLDLQVDVPPEFRDLHYEDLSGWNGEPQAVEIIKLTARARGLVGSSVPSPPPRRTTLFVCYRREDTADAAGRLHDTLSGAYGSEQVFMDIDNIPLGVNFVTHINQQLQGCAAVLVMIGRSWTLITDAEGKRRLDDPEDHVRVEVATALKQGVPVIPILVQNASMPRAPDLPEDIRDLAFYNGMKLAPEFWRAGVQKLIKELNRGDERVATCYSHSDQRHQLALSARPSDPPQRPLAHA